MTSWWVSSATGTAQQLHDRPWPDPYRRAIAVCRPIGRAVVLGSTQSPPTGDLPPGAAVARRTSGGGAVWVTPGEFVWIDVDLPRGDRLWEDDVSRSFLWLGRTWAAALAKVGVKGATVWEEALWCGPAGRDICFATQAPGEVSVAGRKVVGITQRRTRAGSRFHCAALLRWNPAVLARAMAVPESAWPELNELAGGLDVVPDELVAAFVEALPR